MLSTNENSPVLDILLETDPVYFNWMIVYIDHSWEQLIIKAGCYCWVDEFQTAQTLEPSRPKAIIELLLTLANCTENFDGGGEYVSL